MAPSKRSFSRASTPLASLRRSTRAASITPESTDAAPLRRFIKAASAAPESTGTPPTPLHRLTRASSAAPESTKTPALPDIPDKILAANTSRASTPATATRRSTRATPAALESTDHASSSGSITATSVAPEANVTATLSDVSKNDDISISNNDDNETNIVTTDTPPPPTEGQERLFHAEVNVELTAEPITQIIVDMAAQAKQNIINAYSASLAASTDQNDIVDFDWVAAAHRAVDEAEVKAEKAVLELVGPVARRAWIEGRAEDELEKGTPAIREDGIGNGAEREDHDAGEDDMEEEAVIASVEMQEESSDEDDNTDTATADDDVTMVDADAAPEAQVMVYEDPNLLLCFCKQPTYGETVYGCEGANCPYEWYHESCLKRVLYKRDLPKPDQDWLCPYCGEYRVKAAMLPPKKKKSKA